MNKPLVELGVWQCVSGRGRREAGSSSACPAAPSADRGGCAPARGAERGRLSAAGSAAGAAGHGRAGERGQPRATRARVCPWTPASGRPFLRGRRRPSAAGHRRVRRPGRSPPRPCRRSCGHAAPAMQEPAGQARRGSLSPFPFFLSLLLFPLLTGLPGLLCRPAGSLGPERVAAAAAPPQRLPEPLPHPGPPPPRLRRREPPAGNAGSAAGLRRSPAGGRGGRGSPERPQTHGEGAGRAVPRVSWKIIAPPYLLQLTAEFTAAIKMTTKNAEETEL